MAIRNYRVIFTFLFVASLAIANAWQMSAGDNQIIEWIPLHCPLLLLFDLRCPTCGLGHALFAAWTGDFAVAWSEHFLGPVLLLLSALGIFLLWLPLILYSQILYGADLFLRRSREFPAIYLFLLVCYCAWGFGRHI